MSRYENTKITKMTNTNSGDSQYINGTKSRVSKYNTTIYKTVPEDNNDIFIITQEGDRLDNLALQFYGNANFWWYIAHVNNLNHINIPAGTSLRIPPSTDNAVGL